MRYAKSLSSALAVAATALLPAGAATVQGVNLSPALIELDSGAFRQDLNLATGELTGFGNITGFNNGPLGLGGRELTYSFGGFILNEAASSLSRLIFNGGTITLFSDGSPNFNVNSKATAEDSEFATPFLTLSGSFFIDFSNLVTTGGTLSASLFSGFTALDVTGGAAAPFFDTDSISVLTSYGPPPTFSLVDSTGSTSVVNYVTTSAGGAVQTLTAQAFANSVFLTALANSVSPSDPSVNVLNFFQTKMGLSKVEATGSADFNVRVIPEPGSLALVGLSLAALGVMARRREKKA